MYWQVTLAVISAQIFLVQNMCVKSGEILSVRVFWMQALDICSDTVNRTYSVVQLSHSHTWPEGIDPEL